MTELNFSHYQEYQTMMRRIEKNNSFRLKVVASLLFADVPLSLIPLTNLYGLGFTVFALLYLIGILISFVFAVPETPKMCILSVILITLGIVSGCVFFIFGIILLFVLAWVYRDSRKMDFLKKQPGYPHFSERFDEQMETFRNDYQPEHPLNNLHDAEMKDAFEEVPEEYTPRSVQYVEMPEAPGVPERSDSHANESR